jgi:hypothetical protein
MEIKYIPAGGTGKYQINDTDLHAPFKKEIRFQAFQWYRVECNKITDSLENGTITKDDADYTMKVLMSTKSLRNLAPQWGKAGLDVLIKLRDRENGVKTNIIKHAWNRIYLNKVNDQNFQDASILLHQQQQQEDDLESTANNELMEVMNFERKTHAFEIPKNSNEKKTSKSGKRRQSRKQDRVEKVQRTQAAVESTVPVIALNVEGSAPIQANVTPKRKRCGNAWCRQEGHSKKTCKTINPASTCTVINETESVTNDDDDSHTSVTGEIDGVDIDEYCLISNTDESEDNSSVSEDGCNSEDEEEKLPQTDVEIEEVSTHEPEITARRSGRTIRPSQMIPSAAMFDATTYASLPRKNR